MQFSSASCHLYLLCPKFLLSSLTLLFDVDSGFDHRQVSESYNCSSTNIASYSLVGKGGGTPRTERVASDDGQVVCLKEFVYYHVFISFVCLYVGCSKCSRTLQTPSFIFGRPFVSTLGYTKVFHGFSQSIQANYRIVDLP